MADGFPLPHSIHTQDDGQTMSFTIGGPNGDKVLAEIRGVQQQFSLAPSEAIALIVGYGIAAMTDQGLIGGRFSEPMSRAEMLRQMQQLIDDSERG